MGTPLGRGGGTDCNVEQRRRKQNAAIGVSPDTCRGNGTRCSGGRQGVHAPAEWGRRHGALMAGRPKSSRARKRLRSKGRGWAGGGNHGRGCPSTLGEHGRENGLPGGPGGEGARDRQGSGDKRLVWRRGRRLAVWDGRRWPRVDLRRVTPRGAARGYRGESAGRRSVGPGPVGGPHGGSGQGTVCVGQNVAVGRGVMAVEKGNAA